jgi:hypothetical protein
MHLGAKLANSFSKAKELSLVLFGLENELTLNSRTEVYNGQA